MCARTCAISYQEQHQAMNSIYLYFSFFATRKRASFHIDNVSFVPMDGANVTHVHVIRAVPPQMRQ